MKNDAGIKWENVEKNHKKFRQNEIELVYRMTELEKILDKLMKTFWVNFKQIYKILVVSMLLDIGRV